MRAYLWTTGSAFALLALAHAWRATAEPHLLRDPVFLATSALAAAACAWALRLLRTAGRAGG